jgi:hypothetical protein
VKWTNILRRMFNGAAEQEFPAPTPIEIAQTAEIWRRYGYQNLEIVDDGGRVHISPRSHLHIQPNKIEFHGEDEHESFKASIRHVQEVWGGSFNVEGSDDFKLKAWAYAQVYGLKVNNYRPSVNQMGEAQRLVTQIGLRRESEMREASSIPVSDTHATPPDEIPPPALPSPPTTIGGQSSSVERWRNALRDRLSAAEIKRRAADEAADTEDGGGDPPGGGPKGRGSRTRHRGPDLEAELERKRRKAREEEELRAEKERHLQEERHANLRRMFSAQEIHRSMLVP